MVDFIVELPTKQAHPVDHPREQWWTLHVDGASKVSEFGVGLILQSPTGEVMEQAIHLSFSTSNNEVEYEIVLAGLDLSLILAATKLEIRSNSQLIVGQIQREYEANDECMALYLDDFLPSKGNCSVQQKGTITIFLSRISRLRRIFENIVEVGA